MDYRELLIKYIQHVGEEEGSVFLPSTHDDSSVVFSKEEKNEIDALADEAFARSQAEDK